jgi:hypothetical protein
VQQELIAEIQRTSIWPVVVTVDGNIRISEESEFIGRDGSYIILLPDGYIKSVKAEFNGLAEVRNNKFTSLWNSEILFVVAGANEFTRSQQTDILNYFSELRIYNCIIVSQEHYVIDNGYSRPIKDNEVDTGVQLVVHTCFPYQKSDGCTEVKDTTLMDSWVISAQGYFTKSTNMFPIRSATASTDVL